MAILMVIVAQTDGKYGINASIGIYFFYFRLQLEPLERLRSEDTPHRFMITHTMKSCWIPIQNKVE